MLCAGRQCVQDFQATLGHGATVWSRPEHGDKRGCLQSKFGPWPEAAPSDRTPMESNAGLLPMAVI